MGLNSRISRVQKDLRRLKRRIKNPMYGDDVPTMEQLADRAKNELDSLRHRRGRIRAQKRRQRA